MTKEMVRAVRYRLVRVRCVLLGCLEADTYPGCHRCGCALYDPECIVYGLLDPVFDFYWRARRYIRRLWPVKRCDQCGKKFVHGYDNELCSEECHDNWLPF